MIPRNFVSRTFILTASLGLICWLVADEVEPVTPAVSPGLHLSVTHESGVTDHRVARQVALTVLAGESPSALLRPGAFTATWEGEFSLEKRSRVYFSFEGSGAAELLVDGKSVLKDQAEMGAVESDRLRLKSGQHRLKVIYQSAGDGAGNIRLMWRGRDFSKEPMPAKLFTHQHSAALASSIELRRGRALYADLKCAQCHESGSGMPEAGEMAPSLVGVGSRLDQQWMAEWLNDPRSLRSHARMPQMVQGQDASDVAAYLATLKADAEIDSFVGEKEKGAKLFHELGCIACHQTDASQNTQQWQSAPIELWNTGRKYKGNALEKFLLNPAQHHASTRMPDFGLNALEAGHLAEFLRGLSEKAPEPVAGDPLKGRALVKSNHCSACHDGVEPAAAEFIPLAGLRVSSESNCIQASGNGPRYTLNLAERNALTAFVDSKKGRDSLKFHNRAEYAGRQWLNLNCAACHQQDNTAAGLNDVHALSAHYAGATAEKSSHGLAPPDLTHMGEKLQTDWMEQLFRGEVSPRTRPWLKQRMPAFASRAQNLAQGFSAQAGVVAEKENKQRELAPIGKTLYGMQGGFGCAACHGAAGAQPLAVFEAPGVNLLHAGQRLREDYFYRWMRDPRRIDHQTVMPKYFTGQNKTTLTEPLDGDGQRQMQAILQWMLSLDEESESL